MITIKLYFLLRRNFAFEMIPMRESFFNVTMAEIALSFGRFSYVRFFLNSFAKVEKLLRKPVLGEKGKKQDNQLNQLMLIF